MAVWGLNGAAEEAFKVLSPGGAKAFLGSDQQEAAQNRGGEVPPCAMTSWTRWCHERPSFP